MNKFKFNLKTIYSNVNSININLGTTRMYKTSKKANLLVTNLLDEIIIGCMLGDLSAEKPSVNSNTRIQFKQSLKNKLYIEHLYSLFQEYCGSQPLILSNFDSRPNKMKEYKAIKFQTLSLPCFNYYREIFYNKEGTKIVPENLENILTAKGLAYWVMDDGFKSNEAFYIATESFTQSEHEIIVKTLKNKFSLNCSYHKTTNGLRTYFYKDSTIKLYKLIEPFLLKHFKYKFSALETKK